MPTTATLALQDFLASIKIVLVNTTLPANIGSTARAMHTMGLSELVVVNPKHPIDVDAIAHAAGATQILQNATLCDTLPEAIADCQWVLAASSRQRHMPQLVITPRQAIQLMLAQFSAQSHNMSIGEDDQPASRFNMAIVFGREDRGLTNEELQLADYHVQIPANPAYGVLNVAAAVQVITSVFFEQASDYFMPEMHTTFTDLPRLASPNKLPQYSQSDITSQTTSTETPLEIGYFIRQMWDEPPITHAQQQQLQAKLLALLEQLELYNPNQPKRLPHRLARLAHRLQLDVKEYELIQATLAKLQRKLAEK